MEQGRFRIALTARSNANRPVAVIDVPVGSSGGGNRVEVLTLAVGGALLVAGLLLLRAR
jgi:hypothetical protein